MSDSPTIGGLIPHLITTSVDGISLIIEDLMGILGILGISGIALIGIAIACLYLVIGVCVEYKDQSKIRKMIDVEKKEVIRQEGLNKTIKSYSRVTTIKTNVLSSHPHLLKKYRKARLLLKKLVKATGSGAYRKTLDDLDAVLIQTISTLQSIADISEPSHENLATAEEKIDAVIRELDSIVSNEIGALSAKFNEIAVPKSSEVQFKIEQLRRKGNRLLETLNKNPTMLNLEDRTRIEIIVKKRIDEVWGEYRKAISLSRQESNADDLLLTHDNGISPDMVIGEIMKNIENILDSVTEDQEQELSSKALKELMVSSRYFDQR